TKLNDANEKEYRFKVASLPEYIDAVKKDKPDMAVVRGEQDCGKDMRVHKSIYSSRADIKKLNTELQNYLTNVVQPVLSMGSYFGLNYPFAAIKSLWQKMGKNAAHDSMGNCVSDRVNNAIKMRYLEVKDTAESLVDSTLRFISTHIKSEKHPITLTVFNTLPFVRDEVINKTLYIPSRNFKIVDYENNEIAYEINSIKDNTNLIKGATIQLNPGENIYTPKKVYCINLNIDFGEIPPYGYKQFYLIPLEDKEIELNKLAIADTKIENEYYQISVNTDGSLNILDKLNKKLYSNQAILEENGDGGDSYNYSPAKKDLIIYSTSQKHQVQVSHGKLQDKLIILFNYMVPKNLEMRSQGITDTKMPVKMVVKLTKSAKMIKFKVQVDNTKPLSHRLCVDFASQLDTNFSIADIQFGTIKRPL
ncbi:MAG: alpha-mannosidase, partial [Lactobacillus sp.]|nr:alpha-mannosidase [Lactobacillus sp.]